MQDLVIDALSQLFQTFQEKLTETIGHAVKESFAKFANGFKKSDANIITEQVDTLNKQTLVDIAARHRAEGSTEVAAYKVTSDDDYIIYLAYTKDKELLDTAVNNYIIIRSASIARDVEKLFNNDQLIILK